MDTKKRHQTNRKREREIEEEESTPPKPPANPQSKTPESRVEKKYTLHITIISH